MIDFNNGEYVKLRQINNKDGLNATADFLIDGESISYTFSTIRDMLIFTNKRIITINVQGLTGKKKDYTSLPFSKLQAFSIETSGPFDLDSELTLAYSGLGTIKLEFTGSTDILEINKFISMNTL